MSEAILVIHAAATCFMVGVIWFVQVVHYPLIARVGGEAALTYHREHVRRTGFVVMPVMLIEFAAAAFIAIERTAGIDGVLAWCGLALLAIVWLTTFAKLVPVHRRLCEYASATDHARLVGRNWVRTGAWTLRGVISILML